MAKKAEQRKISDNTGLTIEQNIYDEDYLLPSADELAKLNALSPDILPWIMERAQKWNKMHASNSMKTG